jgi:hypothetical protein
LTIQEVSRVGSRPRTNACGRLDQVNTIGNFFDNTGENTTITVALGGTFDFGIGGEQAAIGDVDSVVSVATRVAGIAIYGAALSTYNLIVARRERSPRVVTTLRMDVDRGGGPVEFTVFILRAANGGKRPVTVTESYLLLPDGKQLSKNPVVTYKNGRRKS